MPPMSKNLLRLGQGTANGWMALCVFGCMDHECGGHLAANFSTPNVAERIILNTAPTFTLSLNRPSTRPARVPGKYLEGPTGYQL